MNTNKDIDKKTLAEELRDAYNMISPFIEKHTSIVCPDCEDLCCMDRHGRYDANDLLFLAALGVDTPLDASSREETDGCRYMMDRGCSLDRWMRPYRCTYFFCNGLLKSMEEHDSKLYRAFLMFFEHMVSIRAEFLG